MATYIITAKNRFGHQTVFAATGLVDFVSTCFHAINYYRWINLSVRIKGTSKFSFVDLILWAQMVFTVLLFNLLNY